MSIILRENKLIMLKSIRRKRYSIIEIWPDKTCGDVKILRVEFEHGISIEIMNLGGIIRSLEVPDREGNRKNIVLNYDSLSHYFQDKAYVGCIIGRYANRIKKGIINLNGKNYQLSCNHGQHHLHGGYNGFDKQIWTFQGFDELDKRVIIKLSHTSFNGEEGYPGTIKVNVEYIISYNSLEISYSAATDEDTIFNPTNHSYFNLSGDFQSTIDDHWLKIAASKILSVSHDLIPDGSLIPVEGSVYDFSKGKLIGNDLFDICYDLKQSAILRHEPSGRAMEITTSFPGLQLYTADYLEEAGLTNRMGVCLETQFFPDSPNHEHFNDTVLRRGSVFSNNTIYSFMNY
ncbi:MAG: galactose mutarotase [Ekhidna sp.]|nr:galactose mutarotase [Ekhidna sp.]